MMVSQAAPQTLCRRSCRRRAALDRPEQGGMAGNGSGKSDSSVGENDGADLRGQHLEEEGGSASRPATPQEVERGNAAPSAGTATGGRAATPAGSAEVVTTLAGRTALWPCLSQPPRGLLLPYGAPWRQSPHALSRLPANRGAPGLTRVARRVAGARHQRRIGPALRSRREPVTAQLLLRLKRTPDQCRRSDVRHA